MKKQINKDTSYLNSYTITTIDDVKKRLEGMKKSEGFNKNLSIESKKRDGIPEKDFKKQVEKDFSDAIEWREISNYGRYAQPKYADLPGNRKKFIEYRRSLGKGAEIIRIQDSKGVKRTVVKKGK